MKQATIKYDNELRKWITSNNLPFDKLHPKIIEGICIGYNIFDDGVPAIMELAIENELNKHESPYISRFYIHVDQSDLNKLVRSKESISLFQ